MSAGAFVFFAVADLTVGEAVAVMGCFAVSSAVAVAMTARKMAANDATARWPVVGSPCEDPEC